MLTMEEKELKTRAIIALWIAMDAMFRVSVSDPRYNELEKQIKEIEEQMNTILYPIGDEDLTELLNYASEKFTSIHRNRKKNSQLAFMTVEVG